MKPTGLDKLEAKAGYKETPDESDASPAEDAAGDILSAIASKDAKALSLALQRHYEHCADSESDDDAEED